MNNNNNNFNGTNENNSSSNFNDSFNSYESRYNSTNENTPEAQRVQNNMQGDENNIYSDSRYYQNKQSYGSDAAGSYENTTDNAQSENTAYGSRAYGSSLNGSQPNGAYHQESEYSYSYRKSTPDVSTAPSNVYTSMPKTKKQKKNGSGKFFAKVIAAALCFGIVAGTVMTGINYAGSRFIPNNNNASSSSSLTLSGSSDKATIKSTSDTKTKTDSSSKSETDSDVSSVVERVMPAMVSINVKATTTVQNPYRYFFSFGGDDTYEQETTGSGSGIIISENESELLIVTNNHVVKGADEINVTFNDGSSCSASVKGTDADYDLAVIAVKLSAISNDTKGKIATAELGSSDDLKLGERAIAIGNALGYGQSVTVGYISALEREVQTTDNTMNLIQTDAAINPGNSGGALLDMSGKVVGINSAKYSDTSVEGMGYAIPISKAKPIIEDLINNTNNARASRAYLGIRGVDVNDSYSNSFGLPTGIYVSSVTEGSPASRAGIQAGDIIIKLNGEDISTMSQLQNKLKNMSAGDKAEITIQRQQRNGGYKEQTVTATLGSAEENSEE